MIVLGRLHPAGPLLLMARELLAVGGFLFALRRGVVLRVDMAGKVSSALTMFATGAVLLFAGAWADWLFWVAVIVAVATLAHYAWRARAEVRGAPRA